MTMELPFAVQEEEVSRSSSNSKAHSHPTTIQTHTNHQDATNRTATIPKADFTTVPVHSNFHRGAGVSLPTSSSSVSSSVSSREQQAALLTTSPQYQNVTGNHSNIIHNNNHHKNNIIHKTAAMTRHKMVLYDNVQPHFYDQRHPHAHVNAHAHAHPHSIPRNNANNGTTTTILHQQQTEEEEEEDIDASFVTVEESDLVSVMTQPRTTYTTPTLALHHYHNLGPLDPHHHFNNNQDVTTEELIFYDDDDDDGDVTNPQKHANTNEYPNTISTKRSGGSDVLSLLLGGPPRSHTGDATTPTTTMTVAEYCQKASNHAVNATLSSSKGDLRRCLFHSVSAASCFRDAARLLLDSYGERRSANDGEGGIHVRTVVQGPQGDTQPGSTLAYGLLVLAHSHARNAKSLWETGLISLDCRHTEDEEDDDRVNANGKDVCRNGFEAGVTAHSNTDMDTNRTETDDCHTKRMDSDRNGVPRHRQRQQTNVNSNAAALATGDMVTKKEERLRATIRASMDRAEADMTDSTFLNTTTTTITSSRRAMNQHPSNANDNDNHNNNQTDMEIASTSQQTTPTSNPVDDMMKLERELRDMDLALEVGLGLGASVASLHSKTTTSTKTITSALATDPDGSFCVVPTSSSAAGSSYMSSSVMWSTNSNHHSGRGGTGTTSTNTSTNKDRVRTVRMDHKSRSVLGGGNHNHVSSLPHSPSTAQSPAHSTTAMNTNTGITTIHNNHHNPGLESSWWGHASAMASSTTSLNSTAGLRSHHPHPHSNQQSHPHSQPQHHPSTSAPANTKQLVRLLDSLKTLGDENASLLREVEEAQKARLEARAARESMRQFKEEYGKRFATLKAALEKFRKQYPEPSPALHPPQPQQLQQQSGGKDANTENPILGSNFVKSSVDADVKKREQVIRKLASDLKKEKEESKKKDAALRKYESFYREVKARSALKAKQREEEEQLRKGGGAAKSGSGVVGGKVNPVVVQKKTVGR